MVECQDWRRDFSCNQSKPMHAHKRVEDMSDPTVRCELQDRTVLPRPGTALISGPPYTCVGWSRHINRSKAGANCIENATRRTGKAFVDTMRSVQVYPPVLFVGENVKGISSQLTGMADSNAVHCLAKLREIGLHCGVLWMDPHNHIPFLSRLRLYFPGVHAAMYQHQYNRQLPTDWFHQVESLSKLTQAVTFGHLILNSEISFYHQIIGWLRLSLSVLERPGAANHPLLGGKI